MDEDQLTYGNLRYKPRRVLETASIESLATYLEQLPTRRDVWRAALLGTLTGGYHRHRLDRANSRVRL